MLIECNQCHKKTGTPQAASRILTIVPTAVVTGVLLGVIVKWAKDQGMSWGICGVSVVAIPLYLFFSWMFWELPRWITKLRYGSKPCPHCGARDWGSPRYSGFGI